ncbi:hypothetical protein CK203_079657 [Vitis vinifera]|uniref:Uncharacterized protein n=1 Tax=Vitis vinifera TaxID=29760 RepID=A0A438DKW2_VITVI|nr:hypothetical protein CK203_079657 [Vitis vinifera]
MARTRGAKSSSPSNRKKNLRKEPVPDPAPQPSPPKAIPPPVKPASPKPLAKRYLTRSGEPSPIPSPVPTPVHSPVQPPVPSPVPQAKSPAPQAKAQEPQAPLPEPQIAAEVAPEESEAGACPVIPAAEKVPYGASSSSKRFFLPRVATDFYQSMTTNQVRDPTFIHFTIDGRHGILGARHIAEALQIPYEPTQFDNFRAWANPTELEMVRTLSRGAANRSHLLRGELPPVMFLIDAFLSHNIYPLQHWTQRRGVLLEALYKMSEGFFFGPHHLIMAALLYFEEKVHKKKLQRADCIPLLFPRLLCQILEHLGYPSEPQLERKRICREPFTLDKWNNMTAYKIDQQEPPQPAARRASPRHIPEGITVAAPAIPRASPAAPASSQPSISAEPRMAIPISEYRELCRALETLTASQSSLAQEMAAIRACQEQMLATQAQQAAILRQLQLHFDLPPAVEPSTDTPAEPHSHPSESHPPEPQAPTDAPTEEADPSA